MSLTNNLDYCPCCNNSFNNCPNQGLQPNICDTCDDGGNKVERLKWLLAKTQGMATETWM